MLGSWIDVAGVKNVLDIGTGSGLLAIMLAQEASDHCQIIGIDIDSSAIQQALENALQSPWSKQLCFETVSIQNFCVNNKFDLIVSNPPYFPINKKSNQTVNQKNSSTTRINARQTTELNHQVLLENVVKYLSTQGRFYCVLPDESALEFIELAESVGLFCEQQLKVKAKVQGKVIRHLFSFRLTETSIQYSDIIIYGEKEKYSTEYRELCKEYYLNF
jgi:tRNA1Val (adenine37-N6)-methyltransferase